MVPVAPVSTGVTFVFIFHLSCIMMSGLSLGWFCWFAFFDFIMWLPCLLYLFLLILLPAHISVPCPVLPLKYMLTCIWGHTLSCIFMSCSFASIGHAVRKWYYYYCCYYYGSILNTTVLPSCILTSQVPTVEILSLKFDVLVFAWHPSQDGHLQYCLISV